MFKKIIIIKKKICILSLKSFQVSLLGACRVGSLATAELGVPRWTQGFSFIVCALSGCVSVL